MIFARSEPVEPWRLAMLVLAMLSLSAFCTFVAITFGAFAPSGARPPPLDFESFWAAARLTLEHGPRAGYDDAVIGRFQRAHSAMPPTGTLTFYYPPSFLLLCLPLALLPYIGSLFVFVGVQAALLWPVCKRILGTGFGWLPVLCSPAFLMNVFSGQNGGLSASCFGFALLSLDRRPWLGGACLGLLSCKPQLAVCVPVALLAARRGRACLAAMASAAMLALLATLVLGVDAWRAFLANAAGARASLVDLPIKWPMMQSFYAGLRLAGFSAATGYGVQIVIAVFVVALLARLCWARPGAGPEMAATTIAAMLVTPYLNDYDLALQSAPIAWMAGQARQTGWLPGEKILLLLLYLAPLFARASGMLLGVTIAPPLLLAMLLAILRRTARA